MSDPSRAWPELVTLSYNEAGRLLDAQERVDNVPLRGRGDARGCRPTPMQHYQPEPKKRTPAAVVPRADRIANEPTDDETAASCRAGRGARCRRATVWRRTNPRHASAGGDCGAGGSRGAGGRRACAAAVAPGARRRGRRAGTPPPPTLDDVAMLTRDPTTAASSRPMSTAT